MCVQVVFKRTICRGGWGRGDGYIGVLVIVLVIRVYPSGDQDVFSFPMATLFSTT